MTTLLAHISIKPDKLEKFEAITEDMVKQTLGTETGVVRYEYWKGQQENFYYCLLSFEDKWAFTVTRCPIITKVMILPT